MNETHFLDPPHGWNKQRHPKFRLALSYDERCTLFAKVGKQFRLHQEKRLLLVSNGRVFELADDLCRWLHS